MARQLTRSEILSRNYYVLNQNHLDLHKRENTEYHANPKDIDKSLFYKYFAGYSTSMSSFTYKKGVTSVVIYIEKTRRYEEEYGLYMFCAHCKEKRRAVPNFVRKNTIMPDITQRDISMCYRGNFFRDFPLEGEEYDVDALFCSGCGKPTLKEDILTIDRGRKASDLYQVSDRVFFKEEKIHISFIFHRMVCKGARLKIDPMINTVVLNTRTGQSFLLSKLYDGKKLGKGLRNISYGSNVGEIGSLSEENVRETFEYIRERKREILGYMPMPFETYIKKPHGGTVNYSGNLYHSFIATRLLIFYNRMPNLPYQSTWSLFEERHRDKDRTKIIAKLKHDNPDPVGFLAKKIKFDLKKSYKRALLTNIFHIFELDVIQSYFKSPDNIVKILGNPFVKIHKKSKFLQDSIERFGETIVANKIANVQTSNMLTDTSEAYAILVRTYPHDIFDLTGTIHELHERFSRLTKRIGMVNHVFDYEEELTKRYDAVYDEYSFRLVKDTDEMIDGGDAMNICVGRLYRNKAAREDCYIVFLRKGRQYVTCIEISGNKKDIIQAKTHCNNCPDGETLKLIHRWIKDKNLRIDTRDIAKLMDPLDYYEMAAMGA